MQFQQFLSGSRIAPLFSITLVVACNDGDRDRHCFADGSLSVSVEDCGAKHAAYAVTKAVQCTTLQMGDITAITSTGSLDKTVSGGTYDMELKAGGGLIGSHFTGNNCEAKDFTLPLRLGTLPWDGIDCPMAAADSVSINFHAKLSSSIPPSLATSTVHLGAINQAGEAVVCVDVNIAKQESLEGIWLLLQRRTWRPWTRPFGHVGEKGGCCCKETDMEAMDTAPRARPWGLPCTLALMSAPCSRSRRTSRCASTCGRMRRHRQGWRRW